MDIFRDPPFKAVYIYVSVALLFFCGFSMGFERCCRPAAVIHSIHLIGTALVIATSTALKYRNWVQVGTTHFAATMNTTSENTRFYPNNKCIMLLVESQVSYDVKLPGCLHPNI